MHATTRSLRLCGLVLLALCAIGPAGLAAPAGAQSPSPSTIVVPGYAVGEWTLDMTVADLLFRLGVPLTNPSAPDPLVQRSLEQRAWDTPPVVALSRPEDNVVAALGIRARGYATPEHAGVGSTEAQVTAAYGAPSATIQAPGRPRLLVYDATGVAFQLAYDPATKAYATVDAVFVFRPGRANQIWRMPQ